MEHTVIIKNKPVRTGEGSIPDGAVCGNGDIGVILGNSGKGMRIYFSKCDMWYANESADSEKAGITCIGYADIDIVSSAYNNYYAEQRMDTGEIFCRFSDGKRFLELGIFASAVSGKVFIDCHHSVSFDFSEPRLCVMPSENGKSSQEENDGISCISREFTAEDGARFRQLGCAAMKKFTDNEKIKQYVISIATVYDCEDPRERIVSDCAGMTEAEYYKEFDAHCSWWREFYSKSYFSCPAAPELELYRYSGLYMLACCARNRRFPPGLFGNFIARDYVSWKGDYHLNYNFQAAFYHLCASNHPELTDGYTAACEDFVPEAEKLAEKFEHCPGVLFPVGIGPLGMYSEKPCGNTKPERLFLGQKSCAAYLGVIFAMRWYTFRDPDFAREHAYPFIDRVCLFWENYLKKDSSGRYNIVGDAIHEVPYYKPDFDENDYKKEINAVNNLLSLGLVRMMFAAAADMADALGEDAQKAKLRREILANLAPFPTYIYKLRRVYRYTEKGIARRRGNSLNIQHIYPAGQIGLSSGRRALNIARNSLLADNRWFDDNGSNSIFPCAARLGIAPEKILKYMHEYIDKFALPNTLFQHGGGMLENCSLVNSTLNEMLMQSHEGIIRLFPVWNRKTDCEFRNLVAYGGFRVSAKMKNGRICDIKIVPGRDAQLKIENPYKRAKVKDSIFTEREILINVSSGEEIRITEV